MMRRTRRRRSRSATAEGDRLARKSRARGGSKAARSAGEPAALAALASRALLMEAAVESSLNAIAMAGLDARLLYANEAFLRLWGAGDRDEVLGRPATEFWQDPAAAAAVVAALESEGRWQGELEGRRFDGTSFTVSLAAHRVDDEHGRPLAMIGSFIETTDARRTRQALARSEARLAEAQRIAGVGDYALDVRAGEITWSDHAFRLVGLDPGTASPSLPLFLELVHPDDRERVRSTMEQALASTYADDDNGRAGLPALDYRLVRPDGAVRSMHTEVSAELDAAGRPVFLHGTLQDVSAVARVERRLREEQEFTAAVIDHAGVLVVVLDREGRIRRFNRACEELSGFRFAEVEGRFPWETVLPPEDAATIRAEAFEAHMRDPGKALRKYANHWVAKSGERCLIEWTNTLLLDENGRPAHMVSIGIDVTEHQRTASALRKSEFRLREAQRIARIGSWELDLVSGRLHWSDEIFRIFEIDPERFGASYETFLEAVHPDDRAAVDGAYTNSLENRTPYEVDHRLLMFDGRIKWVHERCESSWDDAGRPLRSVGTVQDVTERRRMEAAVEREARRNELILQTALDGLVVLDLKGRIREANPAYCSQVGYSRAELLGMRVQDLEVVESAEEVAAHMEKLARDGHDRFATRHRRKDGEVIDVEVSANLVDTGEGGFVFSSIRDITDRVQAGAELAASRAHLQAIIDHEPECVTLLDRDGRLLDMNPAGLAMIEAGSLDVVRGRSVSELVVPDDRAAFDEMISAVPRGEHRRLAFSIRGLAGRTRHVESHSVPLWDDSGCSVKAILSVTRDITEQRQAALALEQSLEEKEILLREIHHRVKNNLQILSSLLHFQAKRVRDPEDLAAFVEGRERLLAMILVHEKLYQSRSLARLDLADYLRSLVDCLQLSFRNRDVRIDVRVDSDAIELPVELALPSGMIVCELLTNVVKYAFPGAPGGAATVAARRTGDQVGLSVADDGVGLPPGFDPEQQETFGWQLVRSLVVQLDGRLEVAGGPPGTRVTISFPLPANGRGALGERP
jgi:PAS domain S-box-containing protein